MKRLFVNILACAALAAAFTLTSCSSDENSNDGGGDGEEAILAGTIVSGEKKSLIAGEYILNGSLIVEEGGTLEIAAGTTIKAKKGFSSYILVARGGKIYANGTADAPILFTGLSDGGKALESGHWGGIILNGKAPISGDKADKSNTALAEINNNYPYGGNDEADNSGTLLYVEIAYAGARSTAEIEHNGLTLNGVGNGTKIENIYVLESADDAIEFFGGTVNVKNLLAVNPDDDMFDFTQGYSGTLSNCYGIWKSSYTSTEADPRGIEADGNFDGNYPDHLRQSNFTVKDMTIVNNAANTTDNVDRMQDAIKIRRGATATIINALVKGTGGTIDLIDMNDKMGNGNAASTISITNSLALTGKALNGEAVVTEAADNTGANTTVFAWTKYSF